jgi:hypothetical protein
MNEVPCKTKSLPNDEHPKCALEAQWKSHNWQTRPESAFIEQHAGPAGAAFNRSVPALAMDMGLRLV